MRKNICVEKSLNLTTVFEGSGVGLFFDFFGDLLRDYFPAVNFPQ